VSFAQAHAVADKKAGKVVNSLVRTSKMTVEEAKKSVVDLKEDNTMKRGAREGRGILKTDRYLDKK
jgi:polyhydroxyalkanoate synthesis regulator phasin